MDFASMTIKERYAMMRMRHAYFSTLVAPYSSIEEFARDKEEWFAIVGIDFNADEKCASLYIQLDDTEYEEYFVCIDDDGKLYVDDVIWWQNSVCANESLNIFTEKAVDEE